MDGDSDGEELIKFAGSAHVLVGDPRIRGTGHARNSSPMHSSVFPAEAGNQGEAESVRKLVVKPYSAPSRSSPLTGEGGCAKVSVGRAMAWGETKERSLSWRGIISLGVPAIVKW